MNINFDSLIHTLPMLVSGMAGIFLVIGVIVVCVYILNRVFH